MGLFKNLFRARPGGSIARNLIEKIPGIGDIMQAIPQNKRKQAENLRKGLITVPGLDSPQLPTKKFDISPDPDPDPKSDKKSGIMKFLSTTTGKIVAAFVGLLTAGMVWKFSKKTKTRRRRR